MLTLSERWFTTQTSSFVRAATATGSMPTGTAPAGVSPPAPTSKISSVLSGVFTAKSRWPSGESATGRTCPLSNSTKDPCANADEDASSRQNESRRERIWACIFIRVVSFKAWGGDESQLSSATAASHFRSGRRIILFANRPELERKLDRLPIWELEARGAASWYHEPLTAPRTARMRHECNTCSTRSPVGSTKFRAHADASGEFGSKIPRCCSISSAICPFSR